MKLSLKLPLAFAAALGLLLLGALFGMVRLNSAIDTYEHDVLQTVAAHKMVSRIESDFAAGVQEWKNVLLRGKEPKDLDKYWASHETEMKKVSAGLKELESMLTDEARKTAVRTLGAEIGNTEDAYKKALEAFNAADHDPIAGDMAARGKDREATNQMDALKKQLNEAEQTSTVSAASGAKSSSAVSLIVMLVAAFAGMVGAVWLSRQIVRPLQEAVHVANEVAHGNLSTRISEGGGRRSGCTHALLEGNASQSGPPCHQCAPGF